MNRTALITGATSGLGLEFARQFASTGYSLIITGRRKEIIRAAADELSRVYGVEVEIVIAELSSDTGIKKVLNAAAKAGSIDVLVNNAGFGLNNLFHNESIENHIKMTAVHINAAVILTRAVLPEMIKRGRGTIINVSSLGSFLPTPLNSIYGGTKAFLNIFTESLHTELKHKGIIFQSLCPGFTSTDFHKSMGVDEEIKKEVKSWMSPEDVVRYSIKKLGSGKVVCIPGFGNRVLRLLPLVLPKKLYYTVIRHVYRKYLD
jgi:hypothetical protein